MTNETLEQEKYRGFTISIVPDEYCDNPRDWSNVATFVCEHRSYELGDEHDVSSAVNRLFEEYVSYREIIEHFVNTRNAKIVEDEDGKYYEYKEKDTGSTYRIDAAMNDFDVAWEMEKYFGLMEKLRLVTDTGNIVWLPISIYDHSGMSIWLGGTSGHADASWDCSTIGFAYVEKCVAEKEWTPNEKYGTWQDWAYAVMKAEMETYRGYVEGDAFGFVIEDEDGCEIDSCWGFIGTDLQEIISECKGIVDSYIARREAEYDANIGKIRRYLMTTCSSGMRLLVGNSIYGIGMDMFGQAVLNRAEAKNNVIEPFSPVNTSDLDMKTARIIASCI